MAQDETLGDKQMCTVLYSMGVNKSNPVEKRKETHIMMTLTSCMLVISAVSIIDLIVR